MLSEYRLHTTSKADRPRFPAVQMNQLPTFRKRLKSPSRPTSRNPSKPPAFRKPRMPPMLQVATAHLTPLALQVPPGHRAMSTGSPSPPARTVARHAPVRVDARTQPRARHRSVSGRTGLQHAVHRPNPASPAHSGTSAPGRP